jgi:hypothetical protein
MPQLAASQLCRETAIEWQGFARIAETGAAFVLVGLALLDVFMTVLYARLGKGILSKRLARAFWWLMDGGMRQCDIARQTLLPLAGPVILISVIVSWAALLITGFALIIHLAPGQQISSNSGGTPSDFVAALYAAGDSMSTIGTSDLAPRSGFYRIIYLAASLVGISVITLTITYVLEVYNALLSHNTFALKLHLATGESGWAVRWLMALGPQGRFDIGYANLSEIGGEMAPSEGIDSLLSCQSLLSISRGRLFAAAAVVGHSGCGDFVRERVEPGFIRVATGVGGADGAQRRRGMAVEGPMRAFSPNGLPRGRSGRGAALASPL